jgi:tRNA 2-selenouridine synthase
MDEQPSIEQFENNLHRILSSMDKSRRIWVEDESRKIGKVVMHQGIWENLNSAPLVLLQTEKHERVQRLVREYGNFSMEMLRESLLKIAKRLGNLVLREALEALDSGDLAKVAEISLTYYDKSYRFSLEKRGRTLQKTVHTAGLSPASIAKIICQ